MADITVTLNSAQVQQALVYARKVKPDATNAELIAELEEAAYWGPGIREAIASWEAAYTREQENANRAAAQAEFLEDFPDKPVEAPPVETATEPAKKRATRKK